MGINLKITLIYAIILFAMVTPVALVSQLGEPFSPAKVRMSPLTQKTITKYCRDHRLQLNPDLLGPTFLSIDTGRPAWIDDRAAAARR